MPNLQPQLCFTSASRPWMGGSKVRHNIISIQNLSFVLSLTSDCFLSDNGWWGGAFLRRRLALSGAFYTFFCQIIFLLFCCCLNGRSVTGVFEPSPKQHVLSLIIIFNFLSQKWECCEGSWDGLCAKMSGMGLQGKISPRCSQTKI